MREFRIALVMALCLPILFACSSDKDQKVTFGVISDVHQDLQEDAAYRLQTFLGDATSKSPDFIIQLGDLCHSTGVEKILSVWNTYEGEKYHMFGNHDMDNDTKEDMLELYDMPAGHYYFDKGGVRFIVLDCTYTRKEGKLVPYDNGNYFVDAKDRDLINPEQLIWFKQIAADSKYPCIVFSHQAFDEIGGSVPNRADFRAIVKELNKDQKKVIAAICGHHHIDAHSVIDGVDYLHINSSSYLWIDEYNKYSKGNMAEYKDPVYAFITVDTKAKTITVDGIQSEFKEPAPVAEDFAPEVFKHFNAGITSRTIHY